MPPPSVTIDKAFSRVRTILLTSFKAGVPVKVVSERLGHANPAFTMNVYQHVTPGMQAQAANTFSQLLHATEDHVEDGGEERV